MFVTMSSPRVKIAGERVGLDLVEPLRLSVRHNMALEE